MFKPALSFAVCALVLGATGLSAQQDRLQLNVPIERAIAMKEPPHEYIVTSRANQALQVVVRQQGTDVIVTVSAPDGKQLAEVDSASQDLGMGGAETAQVRALSAGEYRVRVAPFERSDAKPGKYTITLAELRDLTPEEIANAQAEIEIAKIEQEFEQALDKGDIATVRRIFRNDGFAVGPTAAATRGAEQHLASFEEEKKRNDKMGATREHTAITEQVIKAFGNTAVSTARVVISLKAKGEVQERFSGQFVHVWAKDQSGWKMVVDHFYPYGRIPREKAPPANVEPKVLEAYTGTYRPEVGVNRVAITVENGALTAQWTTPLETFPKAPLIPISDTTFRAPATDEFTFVRSPDGQVREIVVVSDGPAERLLKVK